jgi:hypothetical protein
MIQITPIRICNLLWLHLLTGNQAQIMALGRINNTKIHKNHMDSKTKDTSPLAHKDTMED